MKISIEDINEIEAFVLILNIGLMNAIKDNAISIEEAENFFYSPYTMGRLESLGVSEKILDLIHLGCELEDVESLIPDKLDDSIKTIKNQSIDLLRSLPKLKLPLNKWLD